MRFKLVGLLHKSSLLLLTLGKKHKVEEIKLDFPADVVVNGDIIEPDKFAFELKSELTKREDLKGNEILFLITEEKAFSKLVGLKTSTIEEEKALLFTEIPFTEEEIDLSIFQFGANTQLLAVPKGLIKSLEFGAAKIDYKASFLPLNQLLAIGFGSKNKQLLGYRLDDHFNLVVVHNDFVEYSKEISLTREKELDVLWAIQNLNTIGIEKIEGITLLNKEDPLTTYFEQNGLKIGLNKLGDDLYPTLIKMVATSQNKIAKYFLGNSPNIKKRHINFPFKKIGLLLGIIVLVTILFGLFFSLNSKNHEPALPATNKNTQPKASVSAQPILSSTPSSQLTITPEASVAKEGLKLKILNGNGVGGDAGRVEKKLNELGYTNSTTSTAPQSGQKDTQLKFSSVVPLSYRKEIQELLQSQYFQILVDEAPESGFDVEIVLRVKK